MKKKVLVVCLLLIVGVVLYSNTFRVPFTFDDYHSIVLNDKIHSWGDWSAIWSFSRARFLTYLTFALNYHFGGLHVTGYHLVNLLIHLSASIVLFFFVLLLTGTAFEPERSFLIAAVASLIFLIHPLQTQAVTYIVQRAASLATLCYLATLWLYLKYRLSPERKRWLYYCLALLVAVAGMFTKEICFTLPLMILMVNLISGKAWRRDCLPFLLTMAVVPALHLSGVKGAGLGEIGRLAEPSGTIGPLTYLFTQFRVLVSYLRLLLFPIKQNLDYDYPVYHSFLVPPVWGSFLLLAFLSGLGFYAYRKGQRFFSLAVAWFFVALAVESSIYPIADVIFEHRLY
ncbi:MAG TPA: tetratricopeptide repeat protein, partial [bacterium]|nr:tetratricopeptide repeat protein [bacterium]